MHHDKIGSWWREQDGKKRLLCFPWSHLRRRMFLLIFIQFLSCRFTLESGSKYISLVCLNNETVMCLWSNKTWRLNSMIFSVLSSCNCLWLASQHTSDVKIESILFGTIPNNEHHDDSRITMTLQKVPAMQQYCKTANLLSFWLVIWLKWPINDQNSRKQVFLIIS